MIQKIKILLLLNILLVNTAFGKELPALFEVRIPNDQYTNTNDGLNKAFNRLIQKLSGSRNKKFLILCVREREAQNREIRETVL